MKKFWEWMCKNGYAVNVGSVNEPEYKSCIEDVEVGSENLWVGNVYFVPTKQMLIGYLEEFIWKKDGTFICMSNKTSTNFVERRYNNLVEHIQIHHGD